ncbi:MFS transporter [Paenibacillus protaetiae]|uniref:MFS transporter n=1 Tax=Paenibacillus protaetiae TaxID=2509456 RepID=A0A4P6F5T9_9BACL|nr:MFS transporter [Paenibacillus protaetiae]QAY68587.1 MFS transporter [Paenibacillus protaetiae]
MVQANESRLPRSLLMLLATASGVCVANLYYNQPLLTQMQEAFHVSSDSIGYVSTATQIGYASGLFLFVPLGDIVNRRKLIRYLMLAAIVALLATSLVPSLLWMYVASFIVGLASVVPQVIIPWVAQIAQGHQQGKAVGTVVGGLLTGILLARTVAGAVGGLWGWRLMYGLAAAIMFVFLLLLKDKLPNSKPSGVLPYGKLLFSMGSLIRKHRTLREGTLIGAINFATFSLFWTVLGFHLGAEPYHYTSEVIGLFGLVGAVGAFCAPFVGRLADRIKPGTVVGIMIIFILAAFLLLRSFSGIIWIVAAIILLDLGIQGAQVANQSRISSLDNDARSRLNTIYMVSTFVGGAFGSFVGSLIWEKNGWAGITWAGLGLGAASIAVWLWHRLVPGKAK